MKNKLFKTPFENINSINKKMTLLIFATVFGNLLMAQTYIDIDATGDNDGTSWENAYTDLGNALVNANTGAEFWVAEGTYWRYTNDRNATFKWTKDSVKVYGGFNGTETLLSQRDWLANRTIMSGNLGGGTMVDDISDNSYTVFVGPLGSSTNILSYGLLDGFVIQGGNANASGSGFGSNGAGYRNEKYNTKMEFHNCEFSNNNAKNGSAFFSHAIDNDIELIIDACIFKNNTGKYGVGSYIIASNGASTNTIITNCLYIDNEIKDMGTLGKGTNSVLYAQVNNATPNFNLKVINTTFANNKNNGTHAENNYGTIMCYANSTATSATQSLSVDNCIFWGNTGDTASIVKNPLGNDFSDIEVKNTISGYSPFPSNAITTNIINQDPLFTSSTDFTLQDGSPAINEGAVGSLVIPLLDLAGNTRIVNNVIDLGCYENQKVGSPNGINNLSFETLKVFPNPTTGIVNISVNETLQSIVLLDITGKQIKSFDSKATQLDVSDVTTGIYFLEVANESKKSVVKLVVR